MLRLTTFSVFAAEITICAVCVLLVPSIVLGVNIRTVALKGQSAPGTNGGVTFSGPFGIPSLNESGQVAFYARLTGNGIDISNDSGIWSEGSGSLELVAREGSPAADLGIGVNFDDLTNLVLNESGHVAFTATLSGSGVSSVNDKGIWLHSSGTSKLVARTGDQAPGTPDGVSFSSFSSIGPLLNNAGQISFSGVLTGDGVESTNDQGIWLKGAEGLSQVVREGSPAPGSTSNPFYWAFPSNGHVRHVLNNAGEIAFWSGLTGEDVNTSNDQSIWAGLPESLALVARKGTPAPDTLPGVNFISLASPRLNDSGQIAFIGRTTYSPNLGSFDGIWSNRSGELALVVRTGTQAPGAPSGTNLSHLETLYLAMNDAGQIAFPAVAGSGIGIWSEQTETLDLVALHGRQAAGTPDGAIFFKIFDKSLAFNAAGQVAFYAEAYLPGANGFLSRGIWATDREGDLQLIVREDEMLELAPGDFRTVSGVAVFHSTGNGDGRASPFNNRGQLAFTAGFADGSQGIFVSNLVAISEPSAFALSALVFLLFGLALCCKRAALPWE